MAPQKWKKKRKRFRPRIHTRDRQAMFLKALEEHGTIYNACRASGTSRITAYYWRNNDPDFAAKWEIALECSVEKLEHSAYDRALKGDTLLTMFLLKAYKPEKYREKHEVKLDVPALNEEIERRLAQLAAGSQDATPPALTIDGKCVNRGTSASPAEVIPRLEMRGSPLRGSGGGREDGGPDDVASTAD